MSEFSWIIGAFGVITTIVGVVIGTVRWMTSASEERINERFKEHKDRFDAHDEALSNNERAIRDTRDELHRDFVRHDHMDKFALEIRDSMSAIFKKMDAVARDLNRLIGRSRKDSDEEGHY